MPGSVCLNPVSSLLVLKQEIRYKFTVHLRLNVLNDEINWTRREVGCGVRARTVLTKGVTVLTEGVTVVKEGVAVLTEGVAMLTKGVAVDRGYC